MIFLLSIKFDRTFEFQIIWEFPIGSLITDATIFIQKILSYNKVLAMFEKMKDIRILGIGMFPFRLFIP